MSLMTAKKTDNFLPLGRPTKYNEEIQVKANEYLTAWEDLKEAVPSVAGLSLYIDIPKRTMYDWGDKFPDFSHTLSKLQTTQEHSLVNKGLKNEINPNIGKFMMYNHGYKEKTEQDLMSSDGSMKQPTKIQLVGVRADDKDADDKD
jgi:hypothetical protein